MKDFFNNTAGNNYDFGKRIQDVRLGGRFLSIDPLFNLFAFWSPYAFAGNNPIAAIDIDGLQPSKDFNVLVEAEVSRRLALQKETNLTAEQLNLIATEWTFAAQNAVGKMTGWAYYNCTNCSGPGGVAKATRPDQYNAPETYRLLVKLKTAEAIKEEAEAAVKESFQIEEIESPIVPTIEEPKSKIKPLTGGNPKKEPNAPDKINFSIIPIYVDGTLINEALNKKSELREKIAILNKDPKVQVVSINVSIIGETPKGKLNAVKFSNAGFETIKNFLIQNGLRKDIKISRGEVGTGTQNGVSFDVIKKKEN